MIFFVCRASAPLDREGQHLIMRIYWEQNRLMRWQIKEITGDWVTVDDILQDTILRLIQKAERLKTLGQRQQRVYVVKTAKAAAIDYMRKRRSRERWTYYPEELSDIPDPKISPEDIALRLDRAESLHNAISLLPELEQDLITFRFFLELGHAEICRITGIKESGYYQRFTLIREHLHKILTKGGWSDEEA